MTSHHKKGLACYQFKYCSHYQPIYKYTQSTPVKSQDPISKTVVSSIRTNKQLFSALQYNANRKQKNNLKGQLVNY